LNRLTEENFWLEKDATLQLSFNSYRRKRGRRYRGISCSTAIAKKTARERRFAGGFSSSIATDGASGT
jgi:hypothetical protein